MAEYKVVIKGIYYGKNRTMPCLNDFLTACNRHPQVGARMKKEYQTIAANAIRSQLKRLKIHKAVRIHYSFYEQDMRRDPSNIAAFFIKVFEDALQQCGVLANDGWFNIAGYSQSFYIDRKNPRIEVTITEEETFANRADDQTESKGRSSE